MDDVGELTARYRSDERSHPDGSPWLVVNMITSLDGAIAVDGLSGGLGNDTDFAVFVTLRRLCDVILVGAGTANAEGYRVPSDRADLVAERAARGQSAQPMMALVSRRLSIDLESALFADPSYRPTVVTTTDADPGRLEAIAVRAEVIMAGTGTVDLADAVRQLSDRHGPVMLAEGGPTLNAELVAADLVDEFCITVSPVAVGGPGGRMLAPGGDHDPRPFAVDRAELVDDLLFTRYLRRR